MVWSACLVLDHKILYKCVDGGVNEVGPLITHKNLYKSKSQKNIFKYKVHDHICNAVFY